MLKRRARALLLGVLGLLAAAVGALAFSGWEMDRKHRAQLDLVRSHLREVVTSDSPSPQWLAATNAPGGSPTFSKEKHFLFLKVWLASWAIDEQALDSISVQGPELRQEWPYVMPAIPPYIDKDEVQLRIDVGSSDAPVEASVTGAGASATIFVGPRALSDCMFDPDWDQDGDIDLDDVEKARRKASSTPAMN